MQNGIAKMLTPIIPLLKLITYGIFVAVVIGAMSSFIVKMIGIDKMAILAPIGQ